MTRSRVVGLILTLTLSSACQGPPAPSSVPSALPSCGTEPPYRVLGPAPCPSAREIDTINREVSVTFLDDPSAGSLVCRADGGSEDLTWVQAQTYMSLAFLRQLSFSTPLPWTDESVYDWFRTTIAGLVVKGGTGNSNCCKPAGVIHIVHNPSFFEGNLRRPTQDDAFGSVLIHEARHVDGPGHTCGLGKDNTIAELGASGVQYYYLKWIAEYSSEPEDLRITAAHRAWLKRTTFCQECFDPRVLFARPSDE